ncbi:MAG: IS3 family transposase [Hyphomicrobiales bacterium]
MVLVRLSNLDYYCSHWLLCNLLAVSRSEYYSWRTRPMSRHHRLDIDLLAHIRVQFAASYYSYDRPQMVEDLRDKGFNVGHTHVGRSMRDNGLKAIRTRKRKRRYKSYNRIRPSMGCSPNLLEQNSTAKAPNQKWVADISYIATSQGWLYLAVVMDLYSRRTIDWSISNRMKQDLALGALQMVITLRCPNAGLVHHSDRDSQNIQQLNIKCC